MTHTINTKKLLNGEPDDMLGELLLILMTLKKIYNAESDAMKNKRLKDFIALQPEKTELMHYFELGLRAVRAKGSAIKSAKASLREALINIQAEIDTLAEQSMNWSLRMAESVRRMQNRLILAGRASMKDDKPIYNPKGTLGTHQTRVQATAINESY